jgi:hypothetical protein
MNLIHPVWLEHDNYTTSSLWTWLVLPDWSMTWIQLPGQELDSSCMTGAWHECNFLVMILTHPVWLEHDMNTTSCSWTWIILPDWSMTWIQLHGHELDSSCLAPAWQLYNLLFMKMTHPAWLEHYMNTTSLLWTWLILPDSSMTWIQLPGYELDSSCLTGAWHEYNFLVKNLAHPAWLKHDMNATSWSWTWFILPVWSMTWIQLPGQELDSSYLTQEWHEYNFLVMNLTHPVWLEHDMNTSSWSRTLLNLLDSSMTWIQLPVHELDSSWLTGALHEYNYLVKSLIHPTWLKNDMNTTFWSWTWPILSDSSMTWMQFPGHQLDSSCLSGAWHEYNFLFMNLTHTAWLEHCINTTTWSRTLFILPTQDWHEYNLLVMNLTHPVWLEHDMNTSSWSRTLLILPDSSMT